VAAIFMGKLSVTALVSASAFPVIVVVSAVPSLPLLWFSCVIYHCPYASCFTGWVRKGSPKDCCNIFYWWL